MADSEIASSGNVSTGSRRRPTAGGGDRLFRLTLLIIPGAYVLLIVLMLTADLAYMLDIVPAAHGAAAAVSAGSPTAPPSGAGGNAMLLALARPEIQRSIVLSLVTCSIAAVLSVIVAVPAGYVLARMPFRGMALVDAILDVPVVLPPLVVGLSLLILFQYPPLSTPLAHLLPFLDFGPTVSLSRLVVYQIPAVILAQFIVASAFAIRTMEATFEHLSPRTEDVAMTLGCSRFQAFCRVVLPEADRGIVTALTLAWARSLGEFGPVLVFAGATRMKTEVLPTTVFMELAVGDIKAAVAVSLIMVGAAMAVLIFTRMLGRRKVVN